MLECATRMKLYTREKREQKEDGKLEGKNTLHCKTKQIGADFL